MRRCRGDYSIRHAKLLWAALRGITVTAIEAENDHGRTADLRVRASVHQDRSARILSAVPRQRST